MGSLDLDNSEHFTFFLHESQGSVRKYAKHPFFFFFFHKQEGRHLLVDKPELISHLIQSYLLFILPFCECVITALHTVLRHFPQNLQISNPNRAQHRSDLYRSWDSAFARDGCSWECVHACVFVWVYQHSFLIFCSCCKTDSERFILIPNCKVSSSYKMAV